MMRRPPSTRNSSRSLCTKFALAPVRDIFQACPDEVESAGRLPGQDVAGVDPAGPAGQPAAGEVGQLRRYVESIRLDPAASHGDPSVDRLHEEPVGTPHVKEGAVPVNGRRR